MLAELKTVIMWLMQEEIFQLPDKLHSQVLEWQRRNFEDYNFLIQNWSKFYPNEPQFKLIAKIGPLKTNTIEVGKFKGRERFHKAKQMDDEMISRSAKIIKAQCSTELGSIQQHRGSLHKAQDSKTQFDVLRVMAEELRHAYQMLYILAADEWNSNFAYDLMDELLSMKTGGHVLDAFNLFFDSFVDNITFCAIIDRVGKYQLIMQQAFSYAPMAQSMGPMLKEEAFHLKTGVEPLRKWVADATIGESNVTIAAIQKHINKWIPRGLEMFGDEKGGHAAIEFGFKDLLNSEAQSKYYSELKVQVQDNLNHEIIRARRKDMSRDQALALANDVLSKKTEINGFTPDDLIYIPSDKFFRRRGTTEYEMYNTDGNKMSSEKEYLNYLRAVLPDPYLSSPDFRTYTNNLKQKLTGIKIEEGPLPFYG